MIGGISLSDATGDKTQNSWSDSKDYWVVKVDSLGTMEWNKRYGGKDGDELYSIQQTADKGYILGGKSSSGIGGNKTEDSWGGWDYWIVKISSTGALQWDHRFGGTDNDYLHSVRQTKDGGYILRGHSVSGISGNKTQLNWGDWDYWIVKTDSLGNFQWDKIFGGSDEDLLDAIQVTDDGGFILGGQSRSGVSGDKTESGWGDYDYWILKTDSLGTKQWDKRFGGSDYDQFTWLQQTHDKGYILGGRSESGMNGDKSQPTWGSYDYWIVKTDSAGNKEWDKDFGGTAGEGIVTYVTQTIDHGFLVSGTSESGANGNKTEDNILGVLQTWVLKTDSLGNIEWDKTIFTLGKELYGWAIQTFDECYLIVNSTSADTGGYKTEPGWDDQGDYWMVKFCDTTPLISLPPDALLSSNDSSVCQFTCVDFFDQSFNAPSSWQWYFDGAIPATSSLQNPSQICYDSAGVFDVTLITCNPLGCDTLILSNFVTVYSNPAPSITTSGMC